MCLQTAGLPRWKQPLMEGAGVAGVLHAGTSNRKFAKAGSWRNRSPLSCFAGTRAAGGRQECRGWGMRGGKCSPKVKEREGNKFEVGNHAGASQLMEYWPPVERNINVFIVFFLCGCYCQGLLQVYILYVNINITGWFPRNIFLNA